LLWQPACGYPRVKVRNPDNLDKVAVGDKVVITYTQAVAVDMTEKPAAE